jgi:hypothetical protein
MPAETETLPGGGWIGLTYGILGGVLILFAWSLTLLRFVPGWSFLGRRSFWLKGHIWLGSLSFILILCHTGLRFGGLFEKILYFAFFLVVLTGIFGVIVQQFVPRWMTLEVACEVPFEQIPYCCATLRDKADREMEKKCESLIPATMARIKEWYAHEVRSFLSEKFNRENRLSDAGRSTQVFDEMRALADNKQPLTELLDRLEVYCDERRLLARQESLHFLLHSWLYLHVPLSWGMTVMMIAHAVMATFYYHQ